MPSTEFVTIGDVHSGAFEHLFSDLPFADELLYRTIAQPVEYARLNGIKRLILLGDLFDTPEPSTEAQVRFLRFLWSLSKFAVEIIPGNHDYSSTEKNSLELLNFVKDISALPHVRLHTQQTLIELDGVPFCFMPWPDAKKKKKYKDQPSVNIAHVEQPGALTDSGRKITSGLPLDTSSDYWVIGHLHRHQQMGRVCYPGTLYQKTFGEPLPKGFCSFTAKWREGLIKVKPKFHPIVPAFELHNLRIEKPKDLLQVRPYSIKENPILRYKLFIHNDVAPPPNFRRDNPHVVKVNGWKDAKELEALERGELDLLQEPAIDLKGVVYRGLSDALKAQGLNKEQRSRARKIVEEKLASIDYIE